MSSAQAYMADQMHPIEFIYLSTYYLVVNGVATQSTETGVQVVFFLLSRRLVTT